MKPSSLSVCALLASCLAIAACSQATDLSRSEYAPNVKLADHREASSPVYSLLYSFHQAPDGNNPAASLLDVGGTLYGTTVNGGTHTCKPQPPQSLCGTVFSITTGGVESVLHSFGYGKDGGFPSADLIDVGGALYGTTDSGGKHDFGTVFHITTSGKENVLHSFGKGTDGEFPSAGLVDAGSKLYSTTSNGGSDFPGWGTVFRITTGGVEKVLHSFGYGEDGTFPSGGLIDVNGTLYGTTIGGGGGGSGNCNIDGCGSIYDITTSGDEKVLHGFGKGSDGWLPAAGLVEVKGTLYGTTESGGAYPCNGGGCGTIFDITVRGSKENVLYSFRGGIDGAHPVAGLIYVNGTLYGTTKAGGAYTGGTVFSITTAGVENVLHSFGNGTDGADPLAGLVDVGGALYGTTSSGGSYGNGTVFALTP